MNSTTENPSHDLESLNAADNSALQLEWFQRLTKLYHSISESSGLQCDTRCHARCCPKQKTAQNIADAIGHVAIMLPFEREHIIAKTGITPQKIQTIRIPFLEATHIDIGFITNELPCPFLSSGNQCSIYEIRPLDCRSFPLIPVFQDDGTLNFRMDNDCPSVITFSSSYKDAFKQLWVELLPHLPMSYRMTFNEL